MTAARIEDLVERCLRHSLSRNGHSLFLVHPATHECITLAAATDEAEAEKTRRRFRRVLCGILHEALRPPEKPEPGPESEGAA